MSFEHDIVFTKENLDLYLKELGREFRKLNGKIIPAEIILVGGAAILTNYGFREMTTDVDGIIHASSSMAVAVERVGDKFGLPDKWLNADCTRTTSYSDKLDEVSVYYRKFSNILTVRTVSAEYLIAMKLKSGRRYKNDLSDIIGILAEHSRRGQPISEQNISDAVIYLYGGWDTISENSVKFIKDTFKNGNYAQIYSECMAEEKQAKDILIGFEEDYPNVTKESNVNDILNTLKKKK